MNTETQTNDRDRARHVAQLRRILMSVLALYVQEEDGVTDVEVVAALSATFCEALVVRGSEIDDDVLHVLRETYKLVAIEHAMREKEDSPATH